jgi:hypothetical protein
VEANSTGGQGSRRAVAPSDDDDDDVVSVFPVLLLENIFAVLTASNVGIAVRNAYAFCSIVKKLHFVHLVWYF